MEGREFYVWQHPTMKDVDIHVYTYENEPFIFFCRAYEYKDRELNILSRKNYSSFFGTLEEAKTFAINLVDGLKSDF